MGSRRFAEILQLRGLVFLALNQPGRCLRDLRAARDMGATNHELQEGLQKAQKLLEELETLVKGRF